jgi:hypothetical protein
LIISGSSAEVGSSNSIAIGSIDSARAIATRCCWPPESWPGNLSLCAIRPTRSSSLSPSRAPELRAAEHLDLRERQVRVTLMCGNSSKFWNTMPMCERSFGRLVFRVADRGAVHQDLALLERLEAVHALDDGRLAAARGPQTTTTSPLDTSVLQSVRTWKLPYHLEMFLIEIIG